MTKTKRLNTYLLALLVAILTVSIVIDPQETYNASLEGVQLWWDIVLPALLPFFILSEVLMGLGVVHFMGAFLEPLMQPLFKVPGVGGFVVAIGLASGYPIGAKITTRLREENLCTRLEAERLIGFTNTADPLFMVGAVAVGMFHNPALGATLAAAHYISSILVGLTLRFWGKEENTVVNQRQHRQSNLFKYALDELYNARNRDSRPIGKLLGDAVTSSMQTMLLVGGFIILFAVLVRVLVNIGAINLLAVPLTWLLKPLQIGSEIMKPLASGVFEITLGAHQASLALLDPRIQLALTSAIIAWSGLSVHGQVAAIISSTDIRYTPYLVARIIHGLYAAIVTYYIYNPTKAVFLATPKFWQPFQNYWILNLPLLQARVVTLIGIIFVFLVLSSIIYLFCSKFLAPFFNNR